MISLFKSIVNKFKAKKENTKFMQIWNSKNGHNNISPVKIFDIDRVRVGSYSYGALDLYAYNKNNKKDILQIGNFVSISSGVKFFLDENHQSKTFTTFPLKSIFFGKQSSDDALSKGSIIICDEVWIGADTKIMSGVQIGKGAIVATGSVVVSNLPPYCIAGGYLQRLLSLDLVERLSMNLFKLI